MCNEFPVPSPMLLSTRYIVLIIINIIYKVEVVQRGRHSLVAVSLEEFGIHSRSSAIFIIAMLSVVKSRSRVVVF